MNLTRMMVQHHVKFGNGIRKLLVSLCLVSMVSIYSPFELAYQVELNTNLLDYLWFGYSAYCQGLGLCLFHWFQDLLLS